MWTIYYGHIFLFYFENSCVGSGVFTFFRVCFSHRPLKRIDISSSLLPVYHNDHVRGGIHGGFTDSSSPALTKHMDLRQYFKRIGFAGSFDQPDLATLKLIHKLHVMSIPFENLSIHCGEKITMDLEDIFNKIVNNSRGGWCFENNFLFGWVLQKMGYDSTMLGSRVFHSGLNDFGPTDNHLINKVVIDGKVYITDVSFGIGNQLWEPLELVSGKDQIQEAGVFRVLDKGDMWVFEKTGRKNEVLNPAFPRGQDHFAEKCHSLQTDPMSLFTNKSICSIQTPTGFKALIGWTYSQVTFSPDKNVDIYDMRNITKDELEKILCEEFNVRLSNQLQPVDRKGDSL
uniref:arylamine N-acetyltransferase n=1 Tax=Neogobius melanostomus TaxID=47308 RepID=A0A8C6U5F3_9GOBI